MILARKFVMPLLILGSMLLSVSCARFVYVTKPDIKSVKSYAIVSLFDSGQGMRWSSKGGLNLLNVINAVTTSTKDFSLQDLATYALNTYEKELSGIDGFSIVPFAKIARTPGYGKFYKTLDDFYKIKPIGYNYPEGMMPIDNYNANTIVLDGSVYVPKQAIMDLCKDAGLDGIIIMRLDIRHKDGGFFQASSTLGVQFDMYDKKAALVLWTPDIAEAQRFETKQTIQMVADTIKYDQEFANLIKMSIDDSARFYKLEVGKAIKE